MTKQRPIASWQYSRNFSGCFDAIRSADNSPTLSLYDIRKKLDVPGSVTTFWLVLFTEPTENSVPVWKSQSSPVYWNIFNYFKYAPRLQELAPDLAGLHAEIHYKEN